MVQATIYDRAGSALIHVNNGMSEQELHLPTGPSLVSCQVSGLPLRAGPTR